MNWDALGAIAELLGAIAVFLTLAYLAIQVRQNSRGLEEQNKFSAAQIMQSKTDTFMTYCSLAVNGTDNIETIGKAMFEPEQLDMNNMQSSDRAKVIVLLAAIRAHFETTVLQVQQGFLTKDFYDGVIVRNIKVWGPAFIKLDIAMSQDFRAEVERVLALTE